MTKIALNIKALRRSFDFAFGEVEALKSDVKRTKLPMKYLEYHNLECDKCTPTLKLILIKSCLQKHLLLSLSFIYKPLFFTTLHME